MRLNVNRVLHTPDASEDFHFEMDLSDLEFGGEKPVSQPVVVDGRIRNKAGMLLLELQASTTLRCRCSRCLDPFDLPKATDYSCVLAEEKQFEDSDDIVLLDHDEVDPEDLARTAFILDMDTVFLCSSDCKGLCSGCGANLNRESCRCKVCANNMFNDVYHKHEDKACSPCDCCRTVMRKVIIEDVCPYFLGEGDD